MFSVDIAFKRYAKSRRWQNEGGRAGGHRAAFEAGCAAAFSHYHGKDAKIVSDAGPWEYNGMYSIWPKNPPKVWDTKAHATTLIAAARLLNRIGRLTR